MSEYQPANLENLFVKRAGRRMRVASCDPTGGNNDNVLIPSGETYLFADLQGPGIVTHFSAPSATRTNAARNAASARRNSTSARSC